MDQSVIDVVLLIMQWVTTIIGAASLIVAALIKVAKLTPTSKDDQWLSGAQAFLASIIKVLDLVAVNPDQDAARRPSGKL
jgi:hypothetical protein